jgi:hypothetical protein
MYIDLSVSRFRNNNIFNDTAKYFQDLITADAERPRAECRADRSPQGAHCFVVVVRDDMSLFLSPEGTPICGGEKKALIQFCQHSFVQIQHWVQTNAQ